MKKAANWILILISILTLAAALPVSAAALTASAPVTVSSSPSTRKLATPNITSVVCGNSGVEVTWGKVSGAAKYSVFCKTGSGSWKRVGTTASTTLTIKTYDGSHAFQSGAKYTFTVRCLSSDGKSYTSDYNTTGVQITYCAAPVLKKVETGNSGVKITWGRVSGAVRYRVYCRPASGSWCRVGETTDTSLTVAKYNNMKTAFKSGETYYFTVRCITADGKYCRSGFDKTGLKLTYCSTPSLSGIECVNGGVKVTWAKVTGAAKYRVYRRTGSGSWENLGDTTALSFTDKTARSGTRYIYTVRCVSADGTTFTSGYNTAGMQITYIAAPVLSKIENTDSGVRLSWKASSGAALYRFYRKTGSGIWQKIGETTALDFTDKTVRSGTRYAYTVRCVTADGKAWTSYFNTAGLSITAGKITSTSKTSSRQIRIAVAVGASGSNTESIVSMLKKCGVSAEVVDKNANVTDYDGLVLPGGGDINPARYGQTNTASTGISDYYDSVQFTLAKKFIDAGKPVLGICRGCQLLNVYFGGTLNQNITGHVKVTHATAILSGSALGSIYGTSLNVYSSHHQSIHKIGSNLNVTMRATDGTIEGIEHAYLPIIGVQWHPEISGETGRKLFQSFIQLCRSQ